MEKRICVIAHDSMKPTLVAFLKEREQWLWNRKFVATGLTAEFMEQESMQLQVEHVNPGRSGGFIELEAMVNRNEIAMAVARLDYSGVMINTSTAFRTDWMPFGGRRHSGLGVGGIGYTMQEYTQYKLVVEKDSR